MTGTRIGKVVVTPVAFRDPPLLNVAGVHEPWALRSIIEVEAETGLLGLGEGYGDLDSLADLGRHAGVVSPVVPWRLRTASGEPARQPVPRFVSNNIPALVEAAVAGLGIAWLAEVHVRDHIAAGTLQEVLQETGGETAPVWLVYPSRGHQPRRVRIVMDWLAEDIGRAAG